MGHDMHKAYTDICELKDTITEYVRCETGQGLCASPAKVAVLGEYIDMIKDLAEAEKSCKEACYYDKVTEAMDGRHRMGFNPYGMDIWTDMMENDRKKGRKRHGHEDEEEEYDDRYGQDFNRFRTSKRHYTTSHSDHDRLEMNQHANDHVMTSIQTLREIWASADTDLKKRMKADLTKMVNEMTV